MQDRLDSGHLLLRLADLARRLQAIGRRLEAKVEQVLDRLAQRECQLLVAHLAVFGDLHGNLSRLTGARYSVAVRRTGSGTASCTPHAPGNLAPPTPESPTPRTESSPA